MKKILFITLVLVLASLACASYDSFFGGEGENGNDAEPTLFPTLRPTATSLAVLPTDTPSISEPTDSSPEDGAATETPSGDVTLTPTVEGEPSTENFYTCVGPCMSDGSNHQTAFAERSKIIYFTFEYENFPPGASYTRWWTLNGVEWARYQCAWPGPASGVEQITLTEPNGLASGTWEVTITIDGVIVLQESLVVQGSWSYWDPAGFFGACYGKR
jgi:hypothetical protein